MKRQPRSPPIWERVFKYFILTANKSRLNPKDWRWFYEFFRRNRARMSPADLKRRLIEGGFTDNCIDEIVCTYDLLRWCTASLTPDQIQTLYNIKHPQSGLPS
jgi:hypothetical protein